MIFSPPGTNNGDISRGGLPTKDPLRIRTATLVLFSKKALGAGTAGTAATSTDMENPQVKHEDLGMLFQDVFQVFNFSSKAFQLFQLFPSFHFSFPMVFPDLSPKKHPVPHTREAFCRRPDSHLGPAVLGESHRAGVLCRA